jgi:hypothetical protein
VAIKLRNSVGGGKGAFMEDWGILHPSWAFVMAHAGRCLLEWEGEGAPPLPLLKDMFASERRKAKVLNFSIAYGKTAHGLSKDWKVSLKEAEETVERWYADRPEVRGRTEKFQPWLGEGHCMIVPPVLASCATACFWCTAVIRSDER